MKKQIKVTSKNNKNLAAGNKITGKVGRPTRYTKELGEKICDMISTCTVGLAEICDSNPGLPSRETIRKWGLKNPEFMGMYARAKSMQADLLVEECLDISDGPYEEAPLDLDPADMDRWVKIQRIKIERDKLRIDTRKFLGMKLLPKKYGDKLFLEQKNEENEKLREELKELQERLYLENKKEY